MALSTSEFKIDTYTRLTSLIKTRLLKIKVIVDKFVEQEESLSVVESETLKTLMEEACKKKEDFDSYFQRIASTSNEDDLNNESLAQDEDQIYDLFLHITSYIKALLPGTGSKSNLAKVDSNPSQSQEPHNESIDFIMSEVKEEVSIDEGVEFNTEILKLENEEHFENNGINQEPVFDSVEFVECEVQNKILMPGGDLKMKTEIPPLKLETEEQSQPTGVDPLLGEKGIAKILLHKKNKRNPSGGRPPAQPLLDRLYARHFIDFLPATRKKTKPRRSCHVCRWTTLKPQKRRETSFWCPDCLVALCLKCFKLYHTKEFF